ncbi:MAG: hypothetical protein HVN35_08685 [Methanobacteriaceae archaeon]|nr:hypothetical protein [Methanobacteriaceae archaeon]
MNNGVEAGVEAFKISIFHDRELVDVRGLVMVEIIHQKIQYKIRLHYKISSITRLQSTGKVYPPIYNSIYLQLLGKFK